MDGWVPFPFKKDVFGRTKRGIDGWSVTQFTSLDKISLSLYLFFKTLKKPPASA
jgi:hypothetical protein